MIIKNKKFLVIGGAGLIGSHLVDQLLKEKVKEILIYDNFTRGNYENISNALKDKRVKVYEAGGDILQYDVLNKAMKNIDGVFHLAALWLLQCNEFPESSFNVNIKGTFNVMDLCIKNKIKKLIYSSSASVYGDAISNPIKEDHPFNNKNFYGATKIACEAMLSAYHYRYNLDFIGLRYMNVYGSRQDYKGAYIQVIMKMLDAIDKNKNIEIHGNGKETFDFVSVIDCARANILAMKSNSRNIFLNVGTGTPTTLDQLAKILLKINNKKLKTKYLIRNKKKSLQVTKRVGSTLLAKKHIDFKSIINLENGLKDLINWRKKHKKSNHL